MQQGPNTEEVMLSTGAYAAFGLLLCAATAGITYMAKLQLEVLGPKGCVNRVVL